MEKGYLGKYWTRGEHSGDEGIGRRTLESDHRGQRDSNPDEEVHPAQLSGAPAWKLMRAWRRGWKSSTCRRRGAMPDGLQNAAPQGGDGARSPGDRGARREVCLPLRQDSTPGLHRAPGAGAPGECQVRHEGRTSNPERRGPARDDGVGGTRRLFHPSVYSKPQG